MSSTLLEDPDVQLGSSGTPPPDAPRPAQVPSIEHAGELEDLNHTPAYLMPQHERNVPQLGKVSCSYCGVGDGGTLDRVADAGPDAAPDLALLPPGASATLWLKDKEQPGLPAQALAGGELQVDGVIPGLAPGAVVRGELSAGDQRAPFVGREIERRRGPDGAPIGHVLRRFTGTLTTFREVLAEPRPTRGCIKLRHSMMRQRVAYPIHTAPSVLDPRSGVRRPISYQEAIARLSRLLLAYRAPRGRTLVYASGQIDYFAVFALQEVLRLLGVRNLTGNAEHCLNAGAVHNELLTGQEGPFVTIEHALRGPNRFYLFNGWNGFISHPPVFQALLARDDLDAYLIEVMVTESAKMLAKSLDKERVLLIRPRSDPHLALGVAHELLNRHAHAIESRFVERFSDPATFQAFSLLARSEAFEPSRVAERIAPEPEYAGRLLEGIRRIALKLAQPGVVPVNIPSVGLSQTSGVVAHCLWGNTLATVGKYGLNSDGSLAGGTLRLPGQINAESEVQGLSRKYFMGRIPMSAAADAAARMDLPEDAYEPVLRDEGRAALDYSDPTPDMRELMLCVGTQFEANMMERRRFIEKLETRGNRLVVIDPIPDDYTLRRAALIIPSPPHPAAAKLYQNGEWKFTLSVPQKQAAPETRSDATILYDAMAEIARQLVLDPETAAAHPDLARHARSGYLTKRFCSDEGGLARIDGEVSRAQLWDRIQRYMNGGSGPLYCSPEHADGRPIAWTELVERGSLYYGGVGVHRYKLDYGDPNAHPFRDVFRKPGKFRFFVPTDADLHIPDGTVLNSGRSTLSDERERIAFAISTFNSGKATPLTGMPEHNPLFVSKRLAQRAGLSDGQRARVKNPETDAVIELPVVISDRVKGDAAYVSFHKSTAQMKHGVYINDVTSHRGRCPYTSQTSCKATHVIVERASAAIGEAARTSLRPSLRAPRRPDPTSIDATVDLPMWSGQDSTLYITDIVHDTHDVYTLRMQGDPLCRFAYWPGQYCTLVLPINGKAVVRSYSISSAPTRPFTLEITIKRVPGGLVSNWIGDNLRVGDPIQVAGPKGKFCLMPGRVPKKILLLGAGSGITPLMSMARWLCDVSAVVDIRFFNSVRSPADIIFHKELELLSSRHRSFAPVVVTSSRTAGQGWTGMSGRISRAMLELLVPDLPERQVYMCGPNGFMDAARALLVEMGFDLANLHAESFGGVRSALAQPAPEGVSIAPPPDPAQLELQVEFARSAKRVRTSRKLALLDLAEAHDIDVDYACRTGNCGACKVRLLHGQVDDPGDGLTANERQAGYVLTCVAKPQGDCVLDA